MKEKQIEGVLRLGRKGYGFVDDIYISEKHLKGAMDGDTVSVALIRRAGGRAGGASPEGKITGIIKEGEPDIVGTVRFAGGSFILVADDRKITFPVIITNMPEELSDGAKVVLTLKLRPGKYNAAEGEIKEVLGAGNEPGMDITSVLASMGIPREFSKEALEEAEELPREPEQCDIEKELAAGREDLRDLSVVTIDGEDTRDIDDGVSISKTAEGGYRLGVHIADVSHYVKEGAALDSDAYTRGTSVYLPDRVVPMLPRKLSNGICSLNEGKDRFAISVITELDKNGTPVSSRIIKSVINVKYKITYDRIFQLYEGGPESGLLKEKYAEHLEELDLMKELAEKLHRRRIAEGSIYFDFPETKVVLDEKGVPVDVRPYCTTFANGIIEEFMVLANETVAAHFTEKKSPFMYRVHKSPDPAKIAELQLTLESLGFSLGGGLSPSPGDVQKLLAKAENTPYYRVVSTVTLRSLQKAEYSGEPLGHYALALKDYCHFTSPIRRYPDLLIHRIISSWLEGKMTAAAGRSFAADMDEKALHCSMTERRADEAERAAVDLKTGEYMEQFAGEKFTGIISGITGFGLFVQLPNSVEGLIRYDTLPEYYSFDSRGMKAVGKRSGHSYHIGDEVEIVVAGVDRESGKAEFTFAGAAGRRNKGISAKKKKRRKIETRPRGGGRKRRRR